MPYSHPCDRDAYFRMRYATDPVFRAKALARSKKRRTNPEQKARFLEYKRKWRQRPENKVKEKEYRDAYRVNNKEYFSSKGSEYRARCRNSKTEPVNYPLVVKRAKGRCGICKKRLTPPIQIDHIVPISKGGTHTYDNLQASHAICNRRKYNNLVSVK